MRNRAEPLGRMSSAVSSRLISGDGARHMACGQEKKSKRVRSEAERGAVTDQFGQYGVIKEADMWDKRPEFMLWCSEVRCLCVRSRVGAPTVGARGVWYAHSDGGGSPCADQEAGSGAVVQVVCRDAAHMRCSIRPTRSPHLSNTLTREGVGGGGTAHPQGGEGDVQGVHGGLQHRNTTPQEGIPTPRASKAPWTLRSCPWACCCRCAADHAPRTAAIACRGSVPREATGY